MGAFGRRDSNLRRDAVVKQVMRAGLVGLAAAMLAAAPIAARHDSTVQETLPGCHAAIDDQATVADRIDGAGRCTGIVEALIYLGGHLPENFRFCVPESVRHHEAVRYIAEEIERDYTRLEGQSFKAAAMAILHRRWPCGTPER